MAWTIEKFMNASLAARIRACAGLSSLRIVREAIESAQRHEAELAAVVRVIGASEAHRLAGLAADAHVSLDDVLALVLRGAPAPRNVIELEASLLRHRFGFRPE